MALGDTVFESNTTENGYGEVAYMGMYTGQTFTPQVAHTIYKVRLKLTKTGSPVGDMTMSILNSSQGVLCVSNAIAMSFITDGTYTFTFTAQAGLSAGRVYEMRLVCTGGDENNFIGIRMYESATVDIYPRGSATNLTPYSDWYFIEYGTPATGPFVAIAGGGTVAASSPDGITWTQRSLPTSSTWHSVAYGNGMFVAISSATGTIAASSPDGITWTVRTLPASVAWHSVAFGGGMFVAVGFNSAVAASSSDGITWTARTLPSSAGWQSVAYGNGVFVAIASGGTVAASSPDGITWTARTMPSSTNWLSVAFGGGVFVAIAWYDTAAATSPDGITWTARTLPVLTLWYSIAYGDGLFVVVQNQGSLVVSSPDGITWDSHALPSNSPWTSVTYGTGMFVAVASGGTVAASSPDGLTWTARTLPASAGWYATAYAGITVPPDISILRSFPWVGRFSLAHVTA